MSVVAQAVTPFNGPGVGWFALSPLLVLVGAALFLLVAGALTPTWWRGLYAFVTAVAAGTAGVLAVVLWDDISDRGPATLVGGALALDTFAMFATIVVCVGLLLVAMVTSDVLHRAGNDGPEIYALYLVAATGGIVMAAANDLIVLFVGLETLSLALYVLAASDRRRAASAESGLKYFVLGGFSSAFFLYGVALIYGVTGSTNISRIVEAFGDRLPIERNDALVLAGVALLLVGLAFKVAAAPFHVWTPDVYQGAPTPVSSFMASVGKAAAFAAMLRVLLVALPFYRDDWRPIVWILAVTSLVVGSFLAVVQTDVKRMLAYSSINHAGFLLVGVEAAAHRAGETDAGLGVSSVLVYLLAYSVLVIGSFAVVALVARTTDGATDLDAFRGLSRRRPALALALTVLLVAQAGVPFTSGFVAKFGVIRAAVDEHSYVLAVVAMVSSVVAAFLYLRIMVAAWITEAPDGELEREPIPFTTGVALIMCVGFTLFVGVVPGWLLDAAERTTDFAR
ncbi:MAG: NADH-quinone oxidoreductase subunit N [Acidimicrobiia bacterium]|nr:NADH-quinone oxidoreductase subunit N [Acidimicrobiia bacterium]